MRNAPPTERELSERKKRLNKSRQETRLFYGFGVRPARAIKICAECGAVCKASEDFCSECGNMLPKKNLYEKSIEDAPKCPYCRAILSGDENFCPLCGKALGVGK